jgi:hypothetical protein
MRWENEEYWINDRIKTQFHHSYYNLILNIYYIYMLLCLTRLCSREVVWGVWRDPTTRHYSALS